MAVIHHTTLKPTKPELLAAWLPSRPWYRGAAEPELTKTGGFRLDDPQGEVWIEFMVVTDASGAQPVAYLVPLAYRGAPLEGAEHALVGTMEHGVLGQRWAYDGCHDPVVVARLAALIEGRAQAQDQNVSDTPAQRVVVSRTGEGSLSTDFTVTDDREGTALTTPQGPVLRLHRALQPAAGGLFTAPRGTIGHVAGSWEAPDGTRAHGAFAVLHGRNRA
ncbi:maltokinase N-terminal cap-like domain-containing protein [Streptomyces cahuitamycinicus]|uniref:1,4-alpha-glucan branching protein n=1 Tax=Streptomyces cahuitamycinicus TaxID=2070367 RepID=A0A2N8TX27_9ACTN|nr:1,4-alpha-glucan branching protein [Streptomyces cahuitamycinicus]PNG23559.1 1,4-alpha-glucan branching protein [Streptomyces cahuitamycinicus]